MSTETRPNDRSGEGAGSGSRKPNRLIHESSPYLRQHAWNPVDWYPWGQQALDRARREERPIFLSIGYSSCHWCHVMERESFEDAHIARLLNKHFVNIKVDREERPDVDAVYMEALQMMTGQGGWPLNIWLTPDQVPVFAGTYFPPQDMPGRPGLASVITRLAQVFRDNPEKVSQQAEQMRKALNNDLYDHLESSSLSADHLDRAFHGYSGAFDENYGGFSTAPKFPTAMGIGFLLRHAHQPGSDKSRHMALFSLENMIRGGIYDQVGGGFHRYSTDSRWLVPHFEKMLYDNALLLPVLAEAAQITGRDLFRRTVDETIAFLNREMRHPDGAYYSALDADTEGQEGRFYTFTHEELKQLLDPGAFNLVTEHYGVHPGGNWEGVSVLHRSVPLEDLAARSGSTTDARQQQLDDARQQLLNYRNSRERPGLDDKIITSWNALMLSALCRCSRLLDRSTEDALRLGRFLAENAVRDDTLYRIIDREGNTKQPGFLDDYALLADGFSRLFELTGDPYWLDRAARLIRLMIGRFHDRDKAAFRYGSSEAAQLVSNTRDVFDNAQPGGTGAAITALYRVGHLAGNSEWIRMAVAAMEPLAETAASHATAFGYLLQAIHMHLHPGREIVIATGNDSRSETPVNVKEEMLRIWKKRYDPNSMVITLPASSTPSDFSSIPEAENLYGDKTSRDGKTTAYVCQEFACQAPVQSPEAFRKQLQSGT